MKRTFLGHSIFSIIRKGAVNSSSETKKEAMQQTNISSLGAQYYLGLSALILQELRRREY